MRAMRTPHARSEQQAGPLRVDAYHTARSSGKTRRASHTSRPPRSDGHTARFSPRARARKLGRAPRHTAELDHESAWGDDESSEAGERDRDRNRELEFGDGESEADSGSEASFYSLAHERGEHCQCSDSDTDDDSVATVLDSPDATIPSPTSTLTSLPEDDPTPKKEDSVGSKETSGAITKAQNTFKWADQPEYGLLSNHARAQLEALGPDWKPDWARYPQEVEPLDPTAPEFEDLLVRAWVAIHGSWHAKVTEATSTMSHYVPILLFQTTEPQEITLRIIHLWVDVCDSVEDLAVIASYLWFDEAGKLPPPPPGYAGYDEPEDHATPRYSKLQQAKRDYPVPRWAFEDGAEYIMKRYSPVYSITSSPRIPPRILRRLLDGGIPDARIYYPLWVPPQAKSKWSWWF